MKKLMSMVCVCILLAGCASAGIQENSRTVKKIMTDADYWQRSDSVSAQYLTGPKAQHKLNTDIASCVTEVRELVRLGSIRKSELPAGIRTDAGMTNAWTSPLRNGPLYAEYNDFQDFDGCMKYKGWERVDFVRPATAIAATRTYMPNLFSWRKAETWDNRTTTPSNDFNK